MYGLEWEQPCLVAEGLAQTSIHKDNYGDLFAKVDEKAQAKPAARSRHLADLYDTIGTEYPHLVAESKWEDGDGSQAAVLDRIPDQVADYLAANIKVTPENFEEQVDAMVHASAYFAASCIFHPPHKPKYDFFIMQVYFLSAIRFVSNYEIATTITSPQRSSGSNRKTGSPRPPRSASSSGRCAPAS